MFNNPFMQYYSNFTALQQPQNNNPLAAFNTFGNTPQQPQQLQHNNNFNTPPQQMQQPSYKVRPVTSYEEARAAIIEDVDGRPNFFTDFNNGYIYVKAVNTQDGNAYINAYKLQPANTMQQQAVSSQDFEAVVNKVLQLEQGFNSIQQNFQKIQSDWGTLSNESTTTSTPK